MQLTSITARYLRRKQPQQFEPAEAEVSVTFVATEGQTIPMDQAQAYYDKALGSVQAVVMAKMGGKAVDLKPVEGLTAVKVEAAAAAPKTTTPVKPAPAAAPAAAAAAPAARKPGRPPKAALPAAAAKPQTDEFGDPVVPAAADDTFDETEQEAAAADAGDDEFAENEVKPMTAVELQNTLSGLVTGKKVAGSDVKAILAKYGVTRSSDAAEADRAKILAEVKALIKVAK